MGHPLEKIESDLLDLPRDVRAHLAEVLLSSLDEEADVEEEWDAEAERRYQRYRAGEVVAIPAAEALAELRARRGK
ncbi:MAG TPA: addiction module protein [Longimicrobium sp.]|nr:addiction module protein [Longimicrobium sp.]